MQTTYTLYNTDGSQTQHTVELPAMPNYNDLSALMQPTFAPDYPSHVSVLVDDEARDLFVAENGHRDELPRNDKATEIYRANYMSKNPEADPENLPHIVGKAFLFDRKVWF